MSNDDLRTNPATEILIAENIKVLRQSQKLIAQMSDRLFAEIGAPTLASSVGAQFRHCLDFYQCFLRGMKNNKIDYDQRERNELLETNRARAMERIEALTEGLWKLSFGEEQATLWVKQDSPYWSVSSLRRELQFLLSHTVHHQALIGLMLQVQGFVPEPEIGVAPSTLEHRRAPRHVFGRLVSRPPRLSLVL